MKKNTHLIMFLCLLGFYSCKKNHDRVASPQVVDVYVAGSDGNYATYWKNGNAVNLGINGVANSITVSDSDVYVAVTVADPQGTTSAIYYKNGVPIILTSGFGANSITVSGNDVYVAGWDDGITGQTPMVAKYWKNGIGINLTNCSYPDAATSIIFSVNDVYVAGYEDDVHGYQFATYWKNGIPVTLPNDSVLNFANSIAVSGNNIYVAGSLGSFFIDRPGPRIAKYWKNSNLVNLTDSSERGFASSIAVSGNDVYIAGSVAPPSLGGRIVPVYWKNGSAVYLTNDSNNIFSYANSIAVSGNDVYVAGNSIDTTARTIVKYWKNDNAAVSYTHLRAHET